MSNNAASNVIPMRDLDGSSPHPQAAQFQRLLKECQNLAWERISTSVSAMLDKVDDSLWGLADQTQDRELRDLIISAKDKALSQRKVIEQQFHDNYLAEFHARTRREQKSSEDFSKFDLSSLELGLVNDDDLEETLRVSEMAAKLRRYCEEELNALDQRLGVLLGDANLSGDANPFSPQAICNAFKQTCRQIDSNMKVRMIFHKLFDDHVLDDVRSIYKDLNGLLIQRSILPKIRYGVRRGGGSAGPRAQIPGASELDAPNAEAEAAAAAMTRHIRIPGEGVPGANPTLPHAGFSGAGFPGAGGGIANASVGMQAVAGGTGAGGEQDFFAVLQSLLAVNAQRGQAAGGVAGVSGGPAGTSGIGGGGGGGLVSGGIAIPGSVGIPGGVGTAGGVGTPGGGGGAPGGFAGGGVVGGGVAGGGVAGGGVVGGGVAGGGPGGGGISVGGGGLFGGTGGAPRIAGGIPGVANGGVAGVGGGGPIVPGVAGIPSSAGGNGTGSGSGGGVGGLSGINSGAGTGSAAGGNGGGAMPAGGIVQIPGFPPILGSSPATGGSIGLDGSVPAIPLRLLQGAELISSLTRLQQGDMGGMPDMQSLNAAGIASGTANVVRDLKASGLGSSVDNTDSVTMDIVAMLFDQIFGDKRVPDALKALIGRLQIPVVKVAVLDKKFFSKKSHPARRMLDSLGELALGLDDSFNPSSPLYRKLEGIVQGVIEDFADNIDIFETLQGELLSVIHEDNRRAELTAKEVARKIAYTERLEVGKATAQFEIRKRSESNRMPRLIQRFLAEHWVKLLLLTHARHGSNGDPWKSALETMDLLIWSANSKQTIEERRKLAHLLPGLLKRLHVGLQAISTDVELRDRFFAKLMRLHTQVISGAAPGQIPPRTPAIPVLTESVPVQNEIAPEAIATAAAAASPDPQQHEEIDALAPPPLPVFDFDLGLDDPTTSQPLPSIHSEPPAEPTRVTAAKHVSASKPAMTQRPATAATPANPATPEMPAKPEIPATPEMSATPEIPARSETKAKAGRTAKPETAAKPVKKSPATASAAKDAQSIPAPQPAIAVAEHRVAAQPRSVSTPEPISPSEAAAQAEADEDNQLAPAVPEFANVTIKNPFGEGEIEVEEIDMSDLPGVGGFAVSGASRSTASSDQYSKAATDMRAGDWIELRDDDDRRIQAKLSYISPLKGTYLFVNRNGAKLREFSLYQLARELRTGGAVMLESVPLIDRAMSSLVGALKKNNKD